MYMRLTREAGDSGFASVLERAAENAMLTVIALTTIGGMEWSRC
jgi:hypothetical protein